MSEPGQAGTSRPFSVRDRLRSFRYAGRGLRMLLATQHNAWLHVLATLAVVGAGWLAGLPRDDWLWLILAMTAVWTAEALNTALEFLADAAQPEYHPLVGRAKDVAAAGVLIAALGAAAIGFVIFGPYLLAALGR